MARFPNALEMRALKYGKRPDTERDKVAVALREADRRSEAILLFDRRPDHPFLQEERTWAIKDGRVFHLLTLRRLGVTIEAADLITSAKAAEAAGRWMEAHLGWQDVGDEEAVRRIGEHLPQALRPAPPPAAEGGGETEATP